MTTHDDALKNILGRWVNALAHEKKLSHHTVRAYDADVTDFFDFLNTHIGKTVTLAVLADCPLTDFRAWIAAKARRDITARSRARAVSSLRHFYKFLDRSGILHNPAIQLLRNPKLDRTIPRPLHVDAAHDVLSMADTAHPDWTGVRDRALFTLLYGGGLRIDEALRLNLSDWPQTGDSMTITGKGNKQRQVVILDDMRTAISDYRAACPFAEHPARPLFLGAMGKRLNQGVAQRSMRSIRAALGLPDTVTPHALRHSFATHLLVDGVNIRAIQELLGHASLSTTQRYTELELADMRHTIEAFHPRGSMDAFESPVRPADQSED
jgi:integrase/recombinase XerC